MSNSPVELPPWTEPDPDEARIARLVAAPRRRGRTRRCGRNVAPGALAAAPATAGPRAGRCPREFGGEACPRPLLVQRYAQLAVGQPDGGVHPLAARRRRAQADGRGRPADGPASGCRRSPRARPSRRSASPSSPPRGGSVPRRLTATETGPGTLSARGRHALGHRRRAGRRLRHRGACSTTAGSS